MKTLIYACWTVFLGFWLVSALGTKSTVEQANWRDEMSYRFPLAVGIALLLTSFGIPALALRIIPSIPAMHILASAFNVAGLFVAIWARTILGGNWSSAVTFKQDHELITRGPYRFVRHPIYTGVLSMLFGTALAEARLGAIAGFAFAFVSLWIKLRREEALMMRYFPSDYPAYRVSSKALIPFVL